MWQEYVITIDKNHIVHIIQQLYLKEMDKKHSLSGSISVVIICFNIKNLFA